MSYDVYAYGVGMIGSFSKRDHSIRRAFSYNRKFNRTTWIKGTNIKYLAVSKSK